MRKTHFKAANRFLARVDKLLGKGFSCSWPSDATVGVCTSHGQMLVSHRTLDSRNWQVEARRAAIATVLSWVKYSYSHDKANTILRRLGSKKRVRPSYTHGTVVIDVEIV